MAGHSKWSQIKRKKGATDVKRGQLFSKLSKEIQVAAKLGGGDPSLNARLRTAISAAKSESMPSDNIERAILKGTGELEGAAAYEELVYEGYGPDGIAVLVETMTDNKNRSAAEIRSIFNKNNGSLGAPGSVAWMFERKAYFYLENTDEETVFEITVDAGAEDIKPDEHGGVEVFCPVDAYDKVEKALTHAGLVPKIAKLSHFPKDESTISDESAAKALKLIETLDDHDDIQNVYSNLSLSDELLEKLSS
ncbi:MAG: YebC/PmpR family DNA-binding transcriptional regulator [Verrucomicrobiota bacterium]